MTVPAAAGIGYIETPKIQDPVPLGNDTPVTRQELHNWFQFLGEQVNNQFQEIRNEFVNIEEVTIPALPTSDTDTKPLWLLYERIAIADGAQTITLTLNTSYGPPSAAPTPPGKVTEIIGWSNDSFLSAGTATFKPTKAGAQEDDPNVVLSSTVYKARDTADPGITMAALDELGVQVVCDAAFVRGESQHTFFALVKLEQT